MATKSKLYSPIFAASWMIGQGVSSRSSHSDAAGRITSAGEAVDPVGISRCCSLSSRENTAQPFGRSKRLAIPAAVARSPLTFTLPVMTSMTGLPLPEMSCRNV